jgi:hypothetical protein
MQYVQPRTQAQITKNRHTTVLLYRSVAKLSERAGVLGETQETKRLAEYVTNMADMRKQMRKLLYYLPIERYIWERFYAQMITAL